METKTESHRKLQAVRHSGFTILEIMIIILIMSIILLIAIPAYTDYRVRARVADMLIVVAPIKLKVAEFYMATQEWPADNGEAGLSSATDYSNKAVQSVTVGVPTAGDITIVSAIDELAGETIVFSPTWVSNKVTWDCDASVGTTIAPQFLPRTCR